MNKLFSSKGSALTTLLLSLFGIITMTTIYFYFNPEILENLPFQLSFQIFPQKEQSSLISSAPVTSEPISLSLNLSSPDNNLLVFDSDILVSGKTSSQATLILSLDEDDFAMEVDTSGNFSSTLKLKNGVNHLIVTVFDHQGNSKSESRTIYFYPSGEKEL